MRIFTITDAQSQCKHVTVDDIAVSPDCSQIDITISRWDNYDDYRNRNKRFPEPLSTEVVSVPIPGLPETGLVNFAYDHIASVLPAHKIIDDIPII